MIPKLKKKYELRHWAWLIHEVHDPVLIKRIHILQFCRLCRMNVWKETYLLTLLDLRIPNILRKKLMMVFFKMESYLIRAEIRLSHLRSCNPFLRSVSTVERAVFKITARIGRMRKTQTLYSCRDVFIAVPENPFYSCRDVWCGVFALCRRPPPFHRGDVAAFPTVT
jgi:hypothetical protein